MWTLTEIQIEGNTVRIYVKGDKSVIFPKFGRYFSLTAENVLDFSIDFLMNKGFSGEITYSRYVLSLEDTAIIDLNQVA